MTEMKLNNIVRGKLEKPRRDCIFAPEGLGKSTFASQADAAVFLGAEDGTAQLDVARFPEPETWQDVMDSIDTMIEEKHTFKHFVIDTLDWVEPLIWKHVCERDGKSDIEAYGYGKGYVCALSEWRILLHKLDAMRHQRGIAVILLAHSHIKAFRNPEGDDYDRYEMKIHTKAAGLVKEWSDNVLFGNYETFTREQSGRAKGIDNGARVLYTERRAAFDAKNRYNLPPKMPLSWDELESAIAKGAVNMKDQIIGLIAQTIGDVKKDAEGMKKRAGKDPQKMAILVNWLKEKVEAA